MQSHKENRLLLIPWEDSGRMILQLQKFKMSFQIPFSKSGWQNSREKRERKFRNSHRKRLQIYYPGVWLRKHNRDNAIKSQIQDGITLIDMMRRSTKLSGKWQVEKQVICKRIMIWKWNLFPRNYFYTFFLISSKFKNSSKKNVLKCPSRIISTCFCSLFSQTLFHLLIQMLCEQFLLLFWYNPMFLTLQDLPMQSMLFSLLSF